MYLYEKFRLPTTFNSKFIKPFKVHQYIKPFEVHQYQYNLKYLMKHEINQVIFKHQSLLYSAGPPCTSCQHFDTNAAPVAQQTPNWRYKQHYSSSFAAEKSRSVFTEMTPVVFKIPQYCNKHDFDGAFLKIRE